MGWKQRYRCRKRFLATSEVICVPNRRLFKRFLTWEERKLKRSNNLRALDEPCYKTLYAYTVRLVNVNRWFENKPWAELTRGDIRRVYNQLEDGRLRNQHDRPFEDLRGYYNKIFKSKPFQLAKKDTLARRIIEYTAKRTKEVRFVNENTFEKLVSAVRSPVHQLLFWLAWDVGENIGTLLKLSSADLSPQENRRSGEREYLVFLPRTKLKRSRVSRGEPTLYPRTVELLDEVLRRRRPNQRLFAVSYRGALRLMTEAARSSGSTTMPGRQPVRWKDLRSGMACHLLTTGWTSDEVNARLGHAPNSGALNCYINFMALSRDDPKHRMRLSRPTPLPSAQRIIEPKIFLCPHCKGVVSEPLSAACTSSSFGSAGSLPHLQGLIESVPPAADTPGPRAASGQNAL